MEILLIRHGETEWNRELIFRGRRDIPLSQTGRLQADLLAKRLSHTQIDAIYSSPLSRALQTAEPLSQTTNSPPQSIHALIDVDFGIWTGLSRDQIRRDHPHDFETWHSDPLQLAFLNGESMADARHRCFSWLSQHAATNYNRIAIVTHRVIPKLLIMSILQAPSEGFWQLRFDTCSLTILSFRHSRFVLNSLNNTNHLNSLQTETLPDF